MTDFSEFTLSSKDAAKIIPGRPHALTVWRWMTKGCRGYRLNSIMVGNKRLTSRDSIACFTKQITDAAQDPSDASAVERELSEAGL
jgi:hypothetical protein